MTMSNESQERRSWLLKRWKEVCARIKRGGKLNPKEVVAEFERLEQAYGRPRRYYHTLTEHIYDCLQKLAQVEKNADLLQVELALWFHDVVYNTRAKDNELRSAEFAAESLTRLGARPQLVAEVKELILLTTHTVAPTTRSQKLVVDIDMSILGSTNDEYARYRWGIWQEYRWVSRDVYKQGRARFLYSLLEREQIFYGEDAREMHENAARRNIQRELATLIPVTQ